jgi:hypothetical protein
VSFDWLEPGVELRGVSIFDEREFFRAERLHVALGLSQALRPRVAVVELERGHLLLGDSLRRLTERLIARDGDDSAAPVTASSRFRGR